MSVTVRPSLLLWLSVLFYLSGEILMPFLLAATLHELGHYLILWHLGHPPRALILGFSGAQMETDNLPYRQEFLAAAAGPVVSLLLGLILPLWPIMGCYSLLLGCINLLPIPGLDGGRMLKSALLLHLTADHALRICRYAAMVTGLTLWGFAVYLAVPKGYGLWPLLLAAVGLYRAMTMDAS